MENSFWLFCFENAAMGYKDHFGRDFEEVVKNRKNPCSKKYFTEKDRILGDLKKSGSNAGL